MPGRRSPESPEDKAIREVDEEDQKALEKIAAEAGPPPDAARLSETDEDEAWETTDPQVEYETMAQMLMTQGLPPEVAQNLIAVKLHPEWLPDYTNPTQDAEYADLLVKLAQWPFRLSLIEDIDDYDERVRKADAIERRYQKRMTALQEQMSQGMMQPTGSYRGMQEQESAPVAPMTGTYQQALAGPEMTMAEG